MHGGMKKPCFHNFLVIKELYNHCSHLFSAQISTRCSTTNSMINYLKACQTHLQDACIKNLVRQMGSIKQSKPSRWVTLQKVEWAQHMMMSRSMDLTSHTTKSLWASLHACMCIIITQLSPLYACMGFLATIFPNPNLKLPSPT